MKLVQHRLRSSAPARRGVALLMAFLVLMVVLAICAQLRLSTGGMQKSTSNETGQERMDLAIESSMLEVLDLLRTDAEDASSSGGAAGGAAGAPAAGGAAAAAGAAAGAAGGAGAQQEPVDSHEDTWGKPQRTEINQVELRVIVQDEDSKLNVLGMLAEDQNEADKAYQRVVKVLDTCRAGTSEDIDSSDAERMAIGMRDHLIKRANSISPRTKLLSDDEKQPDLGLPLTLKEFGAIEPFKPEHFRDYRDERGKIVHSIGAFLTVHTALRTGDSLLPLVPGAPLPSGSSAGGNANPAGGTPGGGNNPNSQTGQSGNPSGAGGNNGSGASGNSGSGASGGSGAPGQSDSGGGASGTSGGIAMNVNTITPCVLKALMDERDVSSRWLDSIVEYRNLEEKKEEDPNAEEVEPVYDEWGRPVIQRQVFDTLEELNQVPGADRAGDGKAELLRMLTTQSQVFSIFVTARIVSANDRARMELREGPPEPGEHEDELGNALTLTVRAIVWRVAGEESTTMVPIVRWEVLDYTPFEVLDYPDEDR